MNVTLTMTPPAPPYTVELAEEHWDALKALPRKSQRETAINFIVTHLPYNPTARIPGKLKKLKVDYDGVYQFDIDQSYRIHYTVDEDAKKVQVQYIGPHPDWGKKSRGGRRIRS